MLLCGQLHPVSAESVNNPSLTISQLKITSSNGQYITLYNATDTALDMTKYQLEYFNNYDVNKATSSRLIPLVGVLPPHEYYMVNDSELTLCYKVSIDSVSLGLSSTAGFVEVLGLNQPSVGAAVTPVLLDYVGWSKTVVIGAQVLPSNTAASLLRQPVDAQNNPSVSVPGSGTWLAVQPDSANPCKFVSNTTAATPIPTGMTQLLPGSEPPYEVREVAADIDGSAPPTPPIPAADIGLMAPKISELLPNPEGTGNDDTDEFIEIYNPNASPFDVSNFQLQTGLTTFHTYMFPAGSVLKPNSFTAFYSADTSLVLSNTSGQAQFLDPYGNILNTAERYSVAKDGQAWILINGKWGWTTKPTPNASNILVKPVAKKTAKSSKTSKSTAATLTAPPKAKSKKSAVSYGQAGYAEPAPTFPVHTATLALIGGLALLYVGYEYRTDLGNKVIELRRNVGAWRKNR
jgi:hypothetical protein